MGYGKSRRNNTYVGRRLENQSVWVAVNGVELEPGPSQALRNHSPDGFEWGYCGSGPAQLALAILLHEYEDVALALALYQDFKRRFVARWPRENGTGWVLTSLEIDAWVSTQPTRWTEGADDD